jgi:hypothetical protein
MVSLSLAVLLIYPKPFSQAFLTLSAGIYAHVEFHAPEAFSLEMYSERLWQTLLLSLKYISFCHLMA